MKTDAVLKSIRTGADRDEVILEHLAFARNIARKVAAPFPRLKEDIEAEGCLELSLAVDRIYHGEVTINDYVHFIKYVNVSVSRRCKDFVERNSRTVNMLGRVIRKRMAHGLNQNREMSRQLVAAELPHLKKEMIMKLPVMYQDCVLEKAKELTVEELKIQVQSTLKKLLPIPKICTALPDYVSEEDNEIYHVPRSRPEVRIEVLEMLRLSIHSPIEEKIIEMRVQGYTYMEIGPKVGMCYSLVGDHVRAIEERYEKYEKM